MNIYQIYLLFWTFAILGWILEVVFCSICDKKIINRGFLIGPYCPIYGFGATIMLVLSPYKDHPFVTFILALFMCSVLEYFTSFLMEKMFNVRWWDYSSDAFNINGRICLRNALAFGALGVLFTRYLNPIYFKYINYLSLNTLKWLSLIILIITLIDIIVSFKAMESIKNIVNKNIKEFKNKDATADIKSLIREKLLHTSYLERRLVQTYHLLERDFKSRIGKLNQKTGSGYGVLLTFLFFGIVVGLILSFIFKLDNYKIVIPFTLSISTLIAFIILKVGRK